MFVRSIHIGYSLLVIAVTTSLLFSHLQYAAKGTNYALCFAFMWCHLALKQIGVLAARKHTAPDGALDHLTVDVIVPIYNEDPSLLAAGIRSMSEQTRLPTSIWLIDDGSMRDDMPFHILEEAVVAEAISVARQRGIRVEPHRQHNLGKRHALAFGFTRSIADVFITVDSDTVLHKKAIEKVIIPFHDPNVMSVAGTACGQNYGKTILTRMIEMGFVMAFIQGRMAEGAFGSVRVNCGIFAAYRSNVVQENIDRLLTHTFLGRPVRAGDDRTLTLFAMERGKTVYQYEAVAYSALPENLSHLVRQRLRWARSFCWGTLWLLARPITSPAFWFTLTQVVALIMYGIVAAATFIGAVSGAVSLWLAISTLTIAWSIGLVTHLRYVIFARPEQSVWERLATWWVSPLTSLLSWTVLMPLYFYAMATPKPQHTWGTRKQVEVGLDKSALEATNSITLPADTEPVQHEKEFVSQTSGSR